MQLKIFQRPLEDLLKQFEGLRTRLLKLVPRTANWKQGDEAMTASHDGVASYLAKK